MEFGCTPWLSLDTLNFHKQSEAMAIRGCSAVLDRAVGVRAFCTIRGATGPIRYNPQAPGTAKPTLRESREDAGVPYSRPLQRWKRVSKTDEDCSLRKLQEQKKSFDRDKEVEAEAEDYQSFACAEIQRLKAEMQARDSSSQRSTQFSRMREKIPHVAEIEEDLSAKTSPRSNEYDEHNAFLSRSSRMLRNQKEAVSATADLDGISLVKKNQMFEKVPVYGNGRKFEAPDSELSKRSSVPLTPRKKKQLQGSGLFYGDGRKFEGLLSGANDLFDDSLNAADDNLFETPEIVVDKEIEKEKQSAKSYALRLLGIAPQTAQKLRQKLMGRNISPSVIESTIADLQRCGLQSDLEYAEAFARSRWRTSIWGPQRLKQELRQRGVSPEDIEAAIQMVFTTSDEFLNQDDDSEDNEGRWGMTKRTSDHLMEKARLQWGRGDSISPEARKRRMIGWLQRRGFNWSITTEVLKSLEALDKQNC